MGLFIFVSSSVQKLESNNSIFGIFWTPYQPISQNNFKPYFVIFYFKKLISA
jgi:hypothetical protein